MSASVGTMISLGKSLNAGINFLYERISAGSNLTSKMGFLALSASSSGGKISSGNFCVSRYYSILSGCIEPFNTDCMACTA